MNINPNRACGHYSAVYRCEPCNVAVRAELKEFPLQKDWGDRTKTGPLFVPWPIAERAWSEYARQYGTQQSVERMAQRGGFSWGEMDMFAPGWREQVDPWRGLLTERDALKARIAELEATLKDPRAVRINILRGQIAVPPDLVWLGDTDGPVAKRVTEAVADEREACAKVAERIGGHLSADAIRARGKK